MFRLLIALALTWLPGGLAEYKPMSVSAYTNADGAWPYQGLTASGVYAVPGVAACGPGYPFGTLVWAPGHGWLTCLDRGPAITNDHIDVWMEDRGAAIEWGRQRLHVLIVRPGEANARAD